MNKQLLDSLSTAVANGRTDIVRSITSACEKNGELSDNITVEELINNPTTLCGTLLHLATKLDHIDIVRTLLSAGANPGIQNNMGETPIDLIATERMTNVYSEELLKATAQSDLNRISQLINAGLSVNVKDSPNSGNTPLHWAACFGNKETIELLINHGADVNIVNSAGTTPLHDAVERGELQIVEKLIKSGGNLFVKATKG
ncbi:tankyrase-like [Centruroides sculpturatus]|nr:tankyrase-like [Centruroides sculpturatus]